MDKRPVHVVIDLETLGTDIKTSPIMQIGAVIIDADMLEPIDTFSRDVDGKSCADYGMVPSIDTTLWWLKQLSSKADQGFMPSWITGENSVHIREALRDFATTLADYQVVGVWGNSNTFDNELLKTAYELCGIKCPWTYREDRCYRTLRSLYPHIVMRPFGQPHVAIDDAMSEAVHLIEILQYMRAIES